jgi:transposase InsO family protein
MYSIDAIGRRRRLEANEPESTRSHPGSGKGSRARRSARTASGMSSAILFCRRARPWRGGRAAVAARAAEWSNRVNQVWSADITYIGMAHGLLYLAAVMDWFSGSCSAWRR